MPEPTRSSDLFAPTMATAVSFDKLMPHRVRNVLVVASPYDAFTLDEGGRLAELVLREFVNLNLSDAPRVTRVSTGAEALDLLAQQSFHLVITMAQIGRMNGITLASRIREIHHDLPVVLLAFDIGELERLRSEGSTEAVDQMFLWTGDARLFIAIIKMYEDQWNLDHDTRVARVRTILLVEDSVRFISLYLPLLYTIIVQQTERLMDEGINLADRLLRLRARPKILLARTYEEAMEIYEQYRPYLLGVISDLSFPREGHKSKSAGLDLLRYIRSQDPYLPALLQSSNEDAYDLAKAAQLHFINKRSPRLLKDVRRYIENNFGFGDFVFRHPDGTEWGRAQSLRDLEDAIPHIPEDSLLYHSSRNDFSNWLRARTEFGLAQSIRPFQLADFDSKESLRRYLSDTLRSHRLQLQRGVITDFSPQRFDSGREFMRIGQGSLGGKGRGLAFANAMLAHYAVSEQYEDVTVQVPPSSIIATDIFDEFLSINELHDLAYGSSTDEEIAHRFVAARLPESVRQDLESFLDRVRYPLAIRSSGQLEDSSTQPFAGIYRTYMLPNNHPNSQVRLAQLARAVKLVYASTFSRVSKSYSASTATRIEDEKMAVILQQVIGQAHGNRFYPHISGVARSHNFYPIAPMRRQDGLAIVALGLGRQVAGGLQALRFSPHHPRHVPAFSSTESTLAAAQRQFYALDLSHPHQMPSFDEEATLTKLDLDAAREDGTLRLVASTYSAENDRLYEGLRDEGYPVVTFAPVLNSEVFPLAAILRRILSIAARGMGSPVELEFAVDLESSPRTFGFLQLRRLVAGGEPDDVRIGPEEYAQSICSSPMALGNGLLEDVEDIVYVRPETFDASQSRTIATEVGELNARLAAEERPYLLIGPGRWGSADPWLGVPVSWDQISQARTIVETSLPDFQVTPSQGTHFFQNMTSLRIRYFTVNNRSEEDRVDWDWLASRPAEHETKYIRHLRLSHPLRILVDGRHNRGVVLPPSAMRRSRPPAEPDSTD